MPFIKQSTKTTLPSHPTATQSFAHATRHTHTHTNTHTRIHREETCTRKTIKQKLEQKLIKFMSPEICFTSKTSNCVEYGAEIKCTWPLRLSVTQIQMGRQAREEKNRERGMIEGAGKLWKTFLLTLVHIHWQLICFFSKTKVMWCGLCPKIRIFFLYICVCEWRVCVCVGVWRCLLQFGLHLSKICLPL